MALDGSARAKERVRDRSKERDRRRKKGPARRKLLEPYVDVDPELIDGREVTHAGLRAAGEGILTTGPKTVALHRVSKRVLTVLREAYPEADAAHASRPLDRNECRGGARPCPFVSCKYNTFLTVVRRGNIKLTHGGLEPWEVDPASSCALDVADAGGRTLEEVGEIMRLTRERVRQLEDAGLARLESLAAALHLHIEDLAPDAVATLEEILGLDAEDTRAPRS